MRGLLSDMVSRHDCVFNLQRTALFIDALYRNDLDMLRVATEDILHQPMRGAKVYPHLYPMMRAALDAGAHGSFLSGAGPTVLSICSGATGGDVFLQNHEERQENAVAVAMKAAAEALPDEHAIWREGRFYICSPTPRGAHVVTADPPFSNSLATFGSLEGNL
eukprot:FR735944.1.p1 GENE.FR735944.1~~FR735944.1.p1  ORF type:complete len:163 (+),score=9.69 FR735944.1:3-491(+)